MKLFDGTYDSVGNSETNLVLKTKGKIKIQYGNKFIDLIKDGKINASSNIIHQVDSLEDIGTNSGIYVTSDGQVIIKINQQSIQLAESVGTTYVSFQQEQNTTPEQRYISQKNIGFISSTIDDIKITSGIVYVEDSKKLYLVSNNSISEYTVDIPNPYNQKFIITKQTSDKGALVIKGNTSNDSIQFDSCDLYSDNSSFYIDSSGTIFFKISDQTIVQVDSTGIKSDRFCSTTVNSQYGFDLYVENGQSTLRVDNIIASNLNTSEFVYPEYWYNNANIIQEYSIEDNYISLTLKYQLEYTEGDVLQVVMPDNTIVFTVVSVNKDSIIVTSNNYINQNLIGKTLFRTSGTTLKRSGDSLDVISDNTIVSRIGNLKTLSTSDSFQKYGMYSDYGIFKQIKYRENYQLELNNNSSDLASTEWVHKLLPYGSIIMFNGTSSIPEGWQLCDGTNNTPDLTEYFISDSTSEAYLTVLIMKTI